MKKKEMIFWAVFVSIGVIFACFVVFYKPISAPSRYDAISVQAKDNAFAVTPDSGNYKEVKKIVNQAINSSRYNLLNPTSTDKVQCSDNAVLSYKFTAKYYWVECFPATGKYAKLFFFVNADAAGRQTLFVFASKNKNTYDGGKIILLYDTDAETFRGALETL